MPLVHSLPFVCASFIRSRIVSVRQGGLLRIEGVLGNFETIDTDIVPDSVSIQSITAIDRITGVRTSCGNRA